jgi:hypothetical protein
MGGLPQIDENPRVGVGGTESGDMTRLVSNRYRVPGREMELFSA